MRQIVTNVYKFAELSDEAKEKAIENLSDINVDHEWWDFIYENAEQVGLKIEHFDLDRKNISITPLWDAADIKKAILSTHGETTETYKTVKAHDLRKDGEADEMIRMLSEDYRILLQEEYDYKISTESIQETIEANEYEFTQEGEMI